MQIELFKSDPPFRVVDNGLYKTTPGWQYCLDCKVFRPMRLFTLGTNQVCNRCEIKRPGFVWFNSHKPESEYDFDDTFVQR